LTRPPHKPLLYLITDRRAFLRNPETAEAEAARLQLEAIRSAAQAGCQLIQIREKGLTAKSLGEFTRAAISIAHPPGARVLVNDRLDVALAAGADGVHLRVSSIPAHEVRAVVKKRGLNGFLIGVSTHSIAEAKSAEDGGADFIVCGPVYDTPSKRAYGAPLGLDRFADVCRAVKIPVLALGGITLSNYREPLRRGASGLAAISLFTDLDRIEQNIHTILTAHSTT
jgi:thiamine-phosphate pyrophosphorylase